MKLWVNIAFHYDTNRLQYLERVLESVKNIKTEKTHIVVNSNTHFPCTQNLEIVDDLYDPYLLTWAHKLYMPKFLESDFTHFVYLEDDMEITDKTFQYWVKTRELFKSNDFNFIPGIHRVEYDTNGTAYSLDALDRIQKESRPRLSIKNKEFISITEPYQGMFIMDRELVEEHISSRFFNEVVMHNNYGIRESANLGNIYVNIPAGWQHRSLIPLTDFSDCWVHHNANNYIVNPNSRHSRIPTESLFY